MSFARSLKQSFNLKRLVLFGIIGSIGVVVNTALLFLLTDFASMHYITASIIATEIAIISNFFGNNYLTFRKSSPSASLSSKFISFQSISLFTLVATVGLLWLFVTLFGKELLLVWNVLAILITFLLNFVLNSTFTWKQPQPNTVTKSSSARNMIIVLVLLCAFILVPIAHAAHTAEHSPGDDNAKDSSDDDDEDKDDRNEDDRNEDEDERDNDNSNEDGEKQEDAVDEDNNDDQSDINEAQDDEQSTVQEDDETSEQDDDVPTENNNTAEPEPAPVRIRTTDDAPSGWQNTSVTVSLTTDDLVDYTEYRINSSAWLTGSQVIISNEGEWFIEYRSHIEGEGAETTRDVTVFIDMTAPTTSDDAPRQSNTSIRVAITSEDVLSGVQTLFWRLNDNPWQEKASDSTEITIDEQGEHILSYYAIDEAGNTEEASTVPITLSLGNTSSQPDNSTTPPFDDTGNSTTPDNVSDNETVELEWREILVPVINPYFTAHNEAPQNIGSSDVQVNVRTDDRFIDFSEVTVTLTNSGRESTYELQLQSRDQNRTHWSTYIPQVPVGNNYLTAITGFNRVSGGIESYMLTTQRGHHRSSPSSSRSSGGGGSPGPRTPEVVFALFSADLIDVQEAINLTVDIRSARAVTHAVAFVDDENGTIYEIPLTLVSGSENYGTWNGTVTPREVGVHHLTSVAITTSARDPITLDMSNTSFYALGEEVSRNEMNLTLVNAILNQSEVLPGESISIQVHLRDNAGINQAVAILRDVDGKQPDIRVSLTRVEGEAPYSTWQEKTQLNQSDTTYALYAIGMTNAQGESRTARVYNQFVYVQYVQPTSTSLTGAAVDEPEEITTFIEQVTPLRVGLSILAIVLLLTITGVIIARNKSPEATA